MGIHFDWTLSFGTVLQMLTTGAVALMAWSVFKTKVEILLKQNADLLEGLSERFTEHERRDDLMFHEFQTRLTDLVGGVQRLVGENTVFRRGSERRGGSNT